jgi:uncharacterized membrane protein SirB2
VGACALRVALVLTGQGWAMAKSWWMRSYGIDTLLMAAGVTLWALLSLNAVASPWLAAGLLLVLYIVLGSLALKRAKAPAARRASCAGALMVYMFMASAALSHQALGFLSHGGHMATEGAPSLDQVRSVSGLQYIASMPRSWSLSAKLGAIGGALLLMAFASIGLTLWVTWQLEGGAAAVNEAGRMRTWRMAQTLARADAQQIAGLAAQFDQSVSVLRTGDPARPLLVPHDALSQEAFAAVQRDWLELKARWTALPGPGAELSGQQADAFVARIDTFVSAIEHHLSRLTAILNAAVLCVPLHLQSAVQAAERPGPGRGG